MDQFSIVFDVLSVVVFTIEAVLKILSEGEEPARFSDESAAHS